MKLKEPKLIKTILDTIKVGSPAGFFGFAPRAELQGELTGPLLVVSAKFAVPQAKFLAMAAKPKGMSDSKR